MTRRAFRSKAIPLQEPLAFESLRTFWVPWVCIIVFVFPESNRSFEAGLFLAWTFRAHLSVVRSAVPFMRLLSSTTVPFSEFGSQSLLRSQNNSVKGRIEFKNGSGFFMSFEQKNGHSSKSLNSFGLGQIDSQSLSKLQSNTAAGEIEFKKACQKVV